MDLLAWFGSMLNNQSVFFNLKITFSYKIFWQEQKSRPPCLTVSIMVVKWPCWILSKFNSMHNTMFLSLTSLDAFRNVVVFFLFSTIRLTHGSHFFPIYFLIIDSWTLILARKSCSALNVLGLFVTFWMSYQCVLRVILVEWPLQHMVTFVPGFLHLRIMAQTMTVLSF